LRIIVTLIIAADDTGLVDGITTAVILAAATFNEEKSHPFSIET
jgi:hypothetical protein